MKPIKKPSGLGPRIALEESRKQKISQISVGKYADIVKMNIFESNG